MFIKGPVVTVRRYLLNILLNKCLFILILATYLSYKYCIGICIDVKYVITLLF